MANMSEPIVFISHNKIKQGKLQPLREYSQQVFQRLHEQKPGTVVFLSYASEDGGGVSFLHIFPDAEAMDAHFEGAERRSKKAAEFIQSKSMEIYGSPSDSVRGVLNQIAESGVKVSFDSDYLGGFLRLKSG
jgi:quinol monooxygenase YgiN